MTPTQLVGWALGGEFRDTVRYFAVKAAVAVMGEADTVDNHVDRLVWAKAVLAGSGKIDELALACATNATISTAAPSIVANDVEFVVNSLVDAFAG
jgi:hypothetical protein